MERQLNNNDMNILNRNFNEARKATALNRNFNETQRTFKNVGMRETINPIISALSGKQIAPDKE